MNRYRQYIKLSALIILLMSIGFASCKSDSSSNSSKRGFNIFGSGIGDSIVSSPSLSFASYISEYSGGLQTRKMPITVKLAVPVNRDALKEKVNNRLFDIEPKLPGEVKWLDEFTVQYIPTTKLLDFAKKYKVNFRLSELFPNTKGLGDFSFNQYTYPADFAIEMKDIRSFTNDNGERRLSVEYTIISSDFVDSKVLEKALVVTQDGEERDFTLSNIGLNRHKLIVDGIDRGDGSSKLAIELKGENFGLSRVVKEEITVPAAKTFSLIKAQALEEGENGVVFIFSNNLEGRNYWNSFSVSELPTKESVSFTTATKENKVFLYFKKDLKEVEVAQFENIFDSKGVQINKAATKTFSLSTNNLKPVVKFSSSEVILPKSKNQKVLFQAKGLKAVDLQIVKVYAGNMKSFFQTNSFKSSNNLRQLGRLVFKQTVALEELATTPLEEMQEFALDLNNLFVQEPGALYYLALSFKPSYTLIDKFYDPQEDLRIKKLTPISKVDEKWNYGGNDYNLLELSIPYKWSDYKWEERANPYDISFYMNDNNVSVSTYVYATNLGVTVKQNSNAKLWVTVNDIVTTKPQGNVEIEVFNYQLIKIGSSSTDNKGFTTIDCRGHEPFLLSAKLNNSTTYLRLVNGEQLSTSRFNVDGTTRSNGLKGFIYGERGVWRPGDTIHVGFILEDLEKRLPKDHPAIFELYNPRGQFYNKQVATAVGNGLYTFKVATKHDDPTGVWSGYVKVGSSSFYKGFRVETIKPNRLKINLNFDSDYLTVGKNNFLLTARWLTGASGANLKADMELSIARLANPFPKYAGYNFSDSFMKFKPEKATVYNGVLNGSGEAKSDFAIPTYSNAPGFLKGTLFARVYEPGGERSIHTRDIKISPFDSYVGVSIENGGDARYLETDIAHKIDLVSLDSDGKPLKNHNLQYKVFKMSWSWWYDRNKLSPNFIESNSANVYTEGELTTDSNGRAFFNFKVDYPSYGYFLIAVKDEKSGHTVFHKAFVDWPYWRGISNKAEGKGVSTFDFKLGKDLYQVGEEVEVVLPPLKNGRALIALENGNKVIKREWVETSEKETTTVRFKATKELLPNAYVFVSLFQPHEQTVNDSPIRLYGVTPLNVIDKTTKLEPVVKVPEVVEPQQEFEIEVAETNGKEMTYTLAIVDDGLLDLTNFKTPNAWNYFFSKEALGISSWDMYGDVLGANSTVFDKIYRVGGDENLEPADAKANRFNPIVEFKGPFVLKAGSKRKHKIKLPMYVGSVRTMVVATGEGAYGSAEANSFVKSSLMLISSLPRVLSIGEDLWVPVNLFALEKEVKTVSLKIETSKNIVVLGDKNKSVQFSKMGDKLQYYHLKVGDNVGVEKIKFIAKSGKYSASEVVEIDVRNPNPQVIDVQQKLFGEGETDLKLNYNLDYLNNSQKVDLTLSTLPPFNLSKRLDFLKGYMHGCTEQITSRALPLLYVSRIQELSSLEKSKIDETINRTINELYARQTNEGGFVYWPGNSYNSPWATQYAGMFLLRAKELGYNVNSQVLSKFVSYLERLVNANSNLNISESYLQAYNLYVLALANKANLSAMNRLLDSRKLDRSTLWILSSAYALAGKDKMANELIFRAKKALSTNNYYYYGSSIRNKSFQLLTYATLNKKEDTYRELKELINQMNTEYYYQTQSTAYGIMAIGNALTDLEIEGVLDFSWAINKGKMERVTTSKSLYKKTLDIETKEGVVALKKEAKHQFFVELVQYKTVKKDTYPAEDKGLSVHVVYKNKDGKSINLSELSQGDDFYAEVYVRNTSDKTLENVALTHIIPANCEIYGADNFVKSGDQFYPTSLSYQDIRDDRVLSYFSFYRHTTVKVKVKLQVAFAGEFIVPAVQAEVMYEPQIFGRSEAGELKIALN